MTEMFGAAFPAAYGDRPPPLWSSEIRKLTAEEISTGFRRLKRQKRNYPPNLTEFLDACRPQSPGPRFLGPQQKPRQLEMPQANPDHVAKCLQHMRSLFGRVREPGEDDEPVPKPAPTVTPGTVAGCNCQGAGTCEVCAAYAARIDGEITAPLPRVES